MARPAETPVKTQPKLKNTLKEQIARYERMHGTRLSQRQLAESLGIAKTTVDRMVNNKTGRYDGDVVISLMAFFEIGPDEFFVVEE